MFSMVNTELMNVVVSCMIVDDFVQLCLDLFKLEGMAGCGLRITSTVELGSGETLRLFVVARSEDSLTTEASLWTK